MFQQLGIGFKSGEIARTALTLPGSVHGLADSTKEFISDVELKMEYIALTMDIQLDPIKLQCQREIEMTQNWIH